MTVPQIISLAPNSGDVTGGTEVTISGYAFTGATAVTVGALAATSFTVVDDTYITATAPAATDLVTGAVDVTVTTPAGTSATTENDQFTYTAPTPSEILDAIATIGADVSELVTEAAANASAITTLQTDVSEILTLVTPAPPAGVTIDSVSDGAFGSAGENISWTHVLTPDATTLVVPVGIGANEGIFQIPCAVTCGETAMTSLIATDLGGVFVGPQEVGLFILMDPPTGEQTITISNAPWIASDPDGTLSAVSVAFAGCASYSYGGFTPADDATTDSAVTNALTCATGDMAVGAMYCIGVDAISDPSGDVAAQQQGGGVSVMIVNTSGPGDIELSATMTSLTWSTVCVQLVAS